MAKRHYNENDLGNQVVLASLLDIEEGVRNKRTGLATVEILRDWAREKVHPIPR